MDLNKSEKTRLGIFLLGSLFLLLFSIFFLVGQKWFERTDKYFTRLEESVGGVSLGSPVKQNGVDIGTITEILTDSIDVQKSVIRFEVKQGTPMKKDMVAALGSYGITGLKYIEITGGSYSAQDIPKGGEVRSTLSMLGKLSLRADSIAQKVDALLGNIVALTGNGAMGNVNEVLKSTTHISRNLDSLIMEIRSAQPGKKMDNILTQFQGAATELHQQISRNQLEKTLVEYQKTAVSMNQVSQKVDLTVAKIQDDLTQTMSNLRETMKNLNTFSRQIKENPSVLLRGENKQERVR